MLRLIDTLVRSVCVVFVISYVWVLCIALCSIVTLARCLVYCLMFTLERAVLCFV